jgi:hypothetical protein
MITDSTGKHGLHGRSTMQSSHTCPATIWLYKTKQMSMHALMTKDNPNNRTPGIDEPAPSIQPATSDLGIQGMTPSQQANRRNQLRPPRRQLLQHTSHQGNEIVTAGLPRTALTRQTALTL